jgi:hypothetical protein
LSLAGIPWAIATSSLMETAAMVNKEIGVSDSVIAADRLCCAERLVG